MMAPFDTRPAPTTRVSMDEWSGYPAARDRLLGADRRARAKRTVVLTGDIHSSWVNELHSGFDRPDRPIVAAEFVGTSITSGGDGEDAWRQFARSGRESAREVAHGAARLRLVRREPQ